MKMFTSLKKVYIISAMIFCLGACSEQKAQPYVDTNESITSTQEQGSIQTH